MVTARLRVLASCLAMAFIGTMAFRVAVPAVAFYARSSLKASALVIGGFMAAFFASRAVAAFTAGFLYNWVRRRLNHLILALFTLAGVTSLCYLNANTIVIIVVRLVQGALLGFAWTLVQSVLGEYTPRDRRGLVYSIYFDLGLLGAAIANMVYAAIPLLETSLVVSLILFSATGLTALALPTTTIVSRETGRGGRATSGTSVKGALLILASLSFFVLAVRLSTAFTQSDIVYILLSEALGLSRSSTADAIAIACFIGAALSILVSYVADKVSDTIAIVLTCLLASLGLILLASLSPLPSILGLALMMIAARCLTPVSRRVAMNVRGSIGIGAVSAAGNIGVILSCLGAGLAYDLVRVNPYIVVYAILVATAIVIASGGLLALSLRGKSYHKLTTITRSG